MARQKGITTLIGTLGDLNFYVAKGKGYVRMAGGGFNGEAIKTKDSMVRVRENATEFGAASTTLKQFRRALLPVFHPPKSKDLHQRLMGLFMELKDLDGVSIRGARRVAKGLLTVKGKHVLKHFDFLPTKALDYIVSKGVYDPTSQTLSFTPMDLSKIPFIKGSTHIALRLIVIDFDFETLSYTHQCSDTVLLGREQIETFSLAPTTVVPPEHTGIVALGLQFCEVFGTEIYPMKGLSGLGCQVIDC
uniref:hypothetical protein n=1 Tax=Gelidibacter sp. TaxID=2018083 RepID=UPI00404A2769